jgi:hypothetical protein
MFTFVDLMRQAQGGQAVDNMAEAFGLKRSDMESLMATLLPVFALGMRKSMQDMARASTLAEALDPDKFRAAYEDTTAAVSPAVTEAGRIALEKMFGSGDAAKVIAAQASAMTGVGADVVSNVMPAMAATLFGGISQQMESGPFAPMLKAFGGGAAGVAGMENPFKDAMSAFFKGYAAGKAKPKAETTYQWPQGMEQFGKLFEAGITMNEANRKAFEKILDSYKA